MLKTLLGVLAVVLISTTLFSCQDDDGFSLANTIGVATIKPLENNAYYLQWDDATTLWPAAGITPDFDVDQERRVFINFTLLGTGEDMNPKYDYIIRVNDIDSVLTKSIAEDLKDKNDKYYGTDPADMKSIWIEDGYINFQFEIYFSGAKKHFINLVKMDDADTYELEFRHNAYGDTSGAKTWGLVAFKLNSLPDTNGETVTIKIKYKSFQHGDKIYEIKYNSDSPTGNAPVLDNVNFETVN